MGYKEKPKLEYMVSMGVNAFHKSVLQFIPRNEYLDMPNLIMKLKSDGKKVMSFRSECEWLDIGRPEDYERAVEMFESAKARYLRES
jgi:NDP-mannose synthase